MTEALRQTAGRDLAPRTVAILGNPNTGKTTLFNALTGLSQKVANYPGVTVERKAGRFALAGRTVELVDLPGTYSLAARSLDEAIAVDVLLGRLPGETPIDAVVAVVDAGNLDRNLFLVSQLLELSLPVVVALNMMDGAARRGIEVNVEALSARLGVPVVPLRADRGEGVEGLKAAIDRVLFTGEPAPPPRIAYPDALRRALDQLVPTARRTSRPELLRALVDVGGPAEKRLTQFSGAFCAAQLAQARREALAHGPLAGLESAARYAWVRAQLEGTVVKPEVPRRTLTERIDAVLTHRVLGLLVLVLALGSLFQALYLGAAPLVDGIDWIFGRLSDGVAAVVPQGPLQSLLLNGVLGGAGSVVAFL
ncbi:MAG TPA: FeoB small GTPase domain-containing protein, partial [Candidatus Polarisedimenticolaceae bacterium]|nr:FeoB small GTPase domain-containing protein [Candidatus Polarisedimenticolaceae bacterium]